MPDHDGRTSDGSTGDGADAARRLHRARKAATAAFLGGVLLLQQEGPLQVFQVAARLGIARSTAHRLLSMLVYRDFAEQDEQKRYRPGPLLRQVAPTPQPTDLLRATALPYLQELVDAAHETVHLMVRVGDQVRFVASVESSEASRVGDREGQALPARQVSGGRALLALLPDAELEDLYDDVALLTHLRRVRQRGFAVNDRDVGCGITAVGVLVRTPAAMPDAAVSLSMPSARFAPARLTGWVAALSATAARIQRAIAEPSAVL